MRTLPCVTLATSTTLLLPVRIERSCREGGGRRIDNETASLDTAALE